MRLFFPKRRRDTSSAYKDQLAEPSHRVIIPSLFPCMRIFFPKIGMYPLGAYKGQLYQPSPLRKKKTHRIITRGEEEESSMRRMFPMRRRDTKGAYKGQLFS